MAPQTQFGGGATRGGRGTRRHNAAREGGKAARAATHANNTKNEGVGGNAQRRPSYADSSCARKGKEQGGVRGE